VVLINLVFRFPQSLDFQNFVYLYSSLLCEARFMPENLLA